MKNKRLGFRKEHVVVLPLENREEIRNYTQLKNELRKSPDIKHVTGCSNVLSRFHSTSPFWWEGAPEGESKRIHKLFVDFDFFDTFKINVVAGREFSEKIGGDEGDSFILNQSAAREFGWESPLGKRMAWARNRDEEKSVIGVIEDFHFRSLHQRIEPLILIARKDSLSHIYVKVRSEGISNAIPFIKEVWDGFFPGKSLEYFFLDNDIDNMYRSESIMGRLFQYLSGLAIFIACLGLFGLISYSTEQRTKEIGIRKVLGASVSGVVALFSREYLRLIAVANLIAWPAAYYFMSLWIRNFAYRVGISLHLFILSAAVVFLLAFLSIGLKTIRAAMTDPVETLRYE